MTPAQFIDDPNWANFLPEMREAPRARPLVTHEDCSPLEADAAAAHLQRGGTLGAMPGYEERAGQLEMLRAIVRAFNAREHLLIEAGTGVGKSLAYLLPAVLWAGVNDTPVVVSTATRNLQSQLMDSDIPRALKVLPEGTKFKVALLKGRGNYLCLRALGDFFAAGYWTMAEDEQREMPQLIEWLRTTPDGDLDDYEGLPRSLLTCPGEECGGRRCPYYSRCFLYRARRRAAEAHLVVVNHALVLAEATSGGGSILPAYGRLVLDEAHNLEEIATDYLSKELSMPELTRLLNRLLRRGKGKRGGTGGILASVERQLQKGILAGNAVGEQVRRLVTGATELVVRIVNAADELLERAEQTVLAGRTREIVRYRGPLDVREAATKFDDAMAAMVNLLHDLGDTLEDAAPENEFNACSDLAHQVGGLAESFIAFANAANFVWRGEQETHVYWAERVRIEKRRAYVRLVAAPLSVAEDLKRLLYDLKDSVILSSATLRVGNDFKYMIRRLGCSERFQVLLANSPFDYFRQAAVFAPDCLPDPAAQPDAYAVALATLLKDLFAVTNGRALVLFTSFEMMRAVAAAAQVPFLEAGLKLLVQGEGLSREAMAAALRLRTDARSRPGTAKEEAADRQVVLFGAQSFWEGVDIAGEALSCVVIARLPFAQVGDPVIEARGEKVEREGGSAFRDYLLPEAVIRFRQGFGRLIRTQRDRGVVVVTDPRLVTKNYGAVFRRSIPASVQTLTSSAELLDRVRGFFGDLQ